DDDDRPRREELGTPPPAPALPFLRDLRDQHLVRRHRRPTAEAHRQPPSERKRARAPKRPGAHRTALVRVGQDGLVVTSLPRYFSEKPLSVPSACMLATMPLSSVSRPAVFGPLLSIANATETVKIGGPSRTRILAPDLTASARPLALATMASNLRPELTAWMHSLSVGSDVTW